VAFKVPNTRGTRLNLVSKSLVAPVDCHTYSGLPYPSYQTLPKTVLSVVSGWGTDIANRARVPSSCPMRTPSALGVMRTEVTPFDAPARSRRVRSEVR
jgi:hypothetical protein